MGGVGFRVEKWDKRKNKYVYIYISLSLRRERDINHTTKNVTTHRVMFKQHPD